MVLFPDLWDDLKLRSSYVVPRFLGCRCGGLGGLGFRAYGLRGLGKMQNHMEKNMENQMDTEIMI